RLSFCYGVAVGVKMGGDVGVAAMGGAWMLTCSPKFDSLKVRTVLSVSPCAAIPVITISYGKLSFFPMQVVTWSNVPAGAPPPVMPERYLGSSWPLKFQQLLPSTFESVGWLGF